MVVIDDGIPNGVQFVSCIVILQWEVVASFVAIWMFSCVSISDMEWLMYVTIIMDEKTESLGSALFLGLSTSHNSGVSKAIRVWVSLQPCVKLWHDGGHVLQSMFDIEFIVRCVVTVDWLVVEVPSGLPTPANSFDIVRPGNALNKWVLILMLLCRVVTELSKQVFSLLESSWVLLLEDHRRLRGGHKMGLGVPGQNLSSA